jgi:hypothetical protein
MQRPNNSRENLVAGFIESAPQSMKRLLLLPLLGVAAVGCSPSPTGVVLYAQSLPATLHSSISPNPASDNVVKYQLIVDGGTPIDVGTTLDTTSCTPGCIRTAFTVNSFGVHTVTWRAANLMPPDVPTSFDFSPPASLSFTLVQGSEAASGGVR